MILNDEKNTVKFGLGLIAILVFVFFIWGGLAPLNSAAVAVGKVGVLSNKKIIQHLEGGVVENIFVKDGDVVKKGQTLITIKNAKLKSSIDVAKNEYLQASALLSRLEAQKDDKETINFNDDIKQMDGFEEAMRGQESIFKEQKKLLDDEISILNKRIEQLKNQINGTNAIVQAKNQRINSLNEEKKEWERLYKEQLTDKIRLRDIQREQTAVLGEVASQNAEITRLNVQITETKQQILLSQRTYKEKILKQFEDAKLKFIDVQSKLQALNDEEERAEIKAPEDGVVVELATHTIGGVVRPSENIMSIVPDTNDYILEGRLQISDIDKVFVGLPADVRFSAFNNKTAHVIEGNITYVSADSLSDQQGNPYYEVKAELTPEGLEEIKRNNFFLLPGMPAEIIIKTGERTMLSYLIKPLTDMFQGAFNED